MIGSQLGPYEITAKLGEGGMGEVYRATDTRLDRQVAVKVLPAAFTEDEGRLARFEREAKLLAQLHHPHIASIFGLEESNGVRALVMELVEGPTLAERLSAGRLPVEEALPIARQIAEALETAHDKGIIHRDLKPQNVKLTPDGRVKVLDFGLAKAMEGAASAQSPLTSPTLLDSPTLTALPGTQLGVILGTASYMAPEQARGQAVDKRADIWAFGVVLYEMLAGDPLFTEKTVSDTLAAVIRKEVDLRSLPATVLPALRSLLRRCLERDPKNRLRDIGDARIALDEIASGSAEAVGAAPPSPTSKARRLPWILAAALAVGLAGSLALRPRASEAPPARYLEISLPPGYLLDSEAPPAFAPDGSAIVFGASDPTHPTRLFLRRLDRFGLIPLDGTERAAFPFWTPDSRAIDFFRDDSLRRYDLATGSTQVLLQTGLLPRTGAWAADGSLLFSPTANSPIQRIPPGGGPPEDVTALDPSILDGSHRFPVFLPDGERFLFTFWTNNLEAMARVGGIYLASVENGVERRLTRDSSPPILAGDRLIVYRDESLISLPFDPKTATVASSGTVIAEKPLRGPASGGLSATASADGDLAFAISSGEGSGEFVWLARDGSPLEKVDVERRPWSEVVLAPDGDRFAAMVLEATGQSIWVGDLERGVVSRLTRGASDFYFPVWAPDGRRLAFSSEATGVMSIHLQPADGSRPAEVLVSDQQREFNASDWSRDGRFLLIDSSEKNDRRGEIWLYDFQQGAARPLLSDPSASLSEGRLSPDTRWLVYTSDESGNPEIFVRPYPSLDRKWKLSQGGASAPHWRHDGREILYQATGDRSILAVTVEPQGEELAIGTPQLLFRPESPLLALTPTADHERFLAGVVPSDVRSEPIRVILGWARQADR